MSKRVAVIGLAVMLGLAGNASATNMGFELGNFGWTSHVPAGGSDSYPASHVASSSTYLPVWGGFFALLKPDGAGSSTRLTQAFVLGLGAVLKGYAAFDSHDVGGTFDDNAWVKVYNAAGTLVATPWAESVTTVGAGGDGPWTSWSWSAPAAGTYTLEYGVMNVGDDILDSHALFDAVPEPSTLLLLGAGLMGLGARARRKLNL